MKTMYQLSFIAMVLLFAAGCKKDEHQVIYKGGTAPVLTVQQGTDVSYVNASKTALTLSWTNPGYQFNTGISSLDVTYNIEIDTAADFSNPNKKVITVSKDLSYSFIVSDLNDIMLNQLLLQAGMPHTLQIRVISSMANSSAQLPSNTLQLTLTPYAIPPKVTPPASGELYLVGSATAGGWDNPVPVPSQKFTQISPTLYEITVSLIGGQEYLFIPVNGDWSHKYAVKDKSIAGLSGGGDFGYDLGDNFPAPANSGTYKITVDFQRGKFTVTPQ
ncbi:hypothetical protein FC093_02865 [Ilyomonas limi]|uniref:SusE outer membrane protein domain-containing protein n=1 Tax=Ilyomonas limi TaxID=2575867 RepID=A0A4U3LB52_9BACT|nr:SusE domain-containing protein [Ilyomonas limi]TKK71969.1 hypothetical protein FC093_02865 [Ilyomonas limi]